MTDATITSAPSTGEMVEVRTRRWIVADVEESALPPDLIAPGRGPEHLITLRCVEDDAEPDESLRVVWEIEPGARVVEAGGLPNPSAFDEPERFAAFLNAVRWSGASASEPRTMLAPFQSGIQIEAYQLEPLAKALRMPRVSLLIADDVGLGKTIEAGLVVQEMLLRYRARRVLIVTPADLTVQWRDEMRDKFGLEFRIVDSRLVRDLRREQGIHANPWTHHPRLITSIDYLKTERPMRRFRETLPAADEPRFPRRWDMLIVDEAHNVAPSGGGRYARASQRTQCLREIIPHVEHRLFLTATPHNGYDESFEALLELLDDQRFARGVEPKKALREVMVRRLKTDPGVNTKWDGTDRFPTRVITPIEVDYPDDERAAHEDLRRYTRLRIGGAGDAAERLATEFVLKLLKKRLLSSPVAFLNTLTVHRRSIDEARRSAATRVTPVDVLRRYVDAAEQPHDLDEERLLAEDTAHQAAARVFRPLTDEERTLLDRLAAWAERAAAQADAKAEAVLERVTAICRTPDGTWNDERLIIFTEYRDTQKWLFELLASRGLTGDERVQQIWGGMDTDERARVKAAFQADPADSPIRVLIGTDAASEGINLQRHCHRVLHYEIPWNPNRLEQRNGRVDRHGQRSPTVDVMHFVPVGWERLRDLADVPVGDLDGDLEFLRRAVEKVEAIRERLGKVGPVIADQVSDAMLGRRRRLDTADAERDWERQSQVLTWERRLRDELREYQEQYDLSRADLQLTPAHVRSVVEIALRLAAQPELVPAREPGVYHVPALQGDAWARCREGLEHPYTGAIRPITFDPAVARDRDDVVLCHLGHRLAQMAVHLLRAENTRPVGTARLNRATAVRIDDPRLVRPLVAVHARLVMVGAGGHRLHEEIVVAGGEIDAGRLQPLGVTALRDMLALPVAAPLLPADHERLLALHPTLMPGLTARLASRVSDRARDLRATLARRRDEQADGITVVLEELGRQIAAELARPPDPQLALFPADDRREYERDRAYLERRLADIPADIERETAAIRDRFLEPVPHAFPVAVEYRLPGAEAAR